jgi:hypothetical protein
MAARDEVDRNRSSYPPMFSANCRPGMARESEGRRRHLDYGEAQSFQDLPLCRFLRLIGDELDAGLAGSSGISVEDFQTHPHDLWVLAPIEHAGKIRSRIASETTYGRSAEATASRTWAPAETPEASTVYKMPWSGMLIPGSAAAPQPPELRAALAPSFQPEPGDPQLDDIPAPLFLENKTSPKFRGRFAGRSVPFGVSIRPPFAPSPAAARSRPWCRS